MMDDIFPPSYLSFGEKICMSGISSISGEQKFADIEVKRMMFFNIIYVLYYWTVLLDNER